MSVRLRLTGIEVAGRHGASAGERDEAQRFIVDLEVEVDPSADELEATADYRRIIAATREIVEKESVVLLETLAERISAGVETVPGVLECRATVHKPNAAGRLGVGDISAEAGRAE